MQPYESLFKVEGKGRGACEKHCTYYFPMQLIADQGRGGHFLTDIF